MRVALLLAGIAAFGGTAFAADPVVVTGDPQPSAKVRIADLNLGSAEGVARVRRRIVRAADGLCLSHVREDQAVEAERLRCFHHARADGYSKLDLILAERRAGAGIASATLTITAR
jgi:UrcA family protein